MTQAASLAHVCSGFTSYLATWAQDILHKFVLAAKCMKCGAYRPPKSRHTAQSVYKHDLISLKYYSTAIFGLGASQVLILQKIGLCRISRSFICSKLQDENGNVVNPHTQRECAGMLMRTLGARFDVVISFQSLQLTRIFFNRYQNLH